MDSSYIDTAVAVLAALAALWATYYQIAQSNKQGLFDHRLKVWSHTRGLMDLCSTNLKYLEEAQEGPDLANDSSFQFMTNNAHLYSIGTSIGHALEPDCQQPLLCKLAELKDLALEARLVFKGDLGKSLALFIESYQALLFSMYQYQILLNHIMRIKEEQFISFDNACESVGEPKQRQKLVDAKCTLLTSYNRLIEEKVEKRVERQCRLR